MEFSEYQEALQAYSAMTQQESADQEPTAVADPDPIDEPIAEPTEPQEQPEPTAARDLSEERFAALERKLDMLGSIYGQQQQEQELARRQWEEYNRQVQLEQQRANHQPRLVLDTEFGPLQQQVSSIHNAMVPLIQAARASEQNAFRAAENALRAKYKDFDEVVSEAERVKAFNGLVSQHRYGNSWEANFERAYKIFAFDKVQAQANELSQKREQKREQQKQASRAVAPSGAPYQKPEAAIDPNERGYDGAAKRFMAALKGAM